MNRQTRLIIGVVLGLTLLSLSAFPQNVKLGSVAPAASPWGKALHRLAGQWSRISNGRVRLKLYLGGVAGGENDMIRKMRIGQLQAAAVTAIGLKTVNPDVLALSVPFLIRTEDEFDYVLANMEGHLEDELEQKGFRVLVWSFTGWVSIFSKRPVVYPEDLKRQKLAVPTSDTLILNSFRAMGFDAISLPVSDLMVGLQSGMVDALYSPPMVAAAFQWFGVANHMSQIRVLPIYAALVVSERTWRRIPEMYKPELLEAVREAERIFRSESGRLEEEALEVMQRHGLVLHSVPPDAEEQWRRLMGGGFNDALTELLPEGVYEMVRNHLEDYRNGRR